MTKTEKASRSGEVNCLGWCGKKFWSPDKVRVRFCPKCRGRRNNASDTLSRMELRLMHSGGSQIEPTSEE